MVDSLDIADVARRTGLTSRALRFYEARGLVQPLRSASGRRHFGPAELERVHQIVTLKRAGLTLAQIGQLARRGTVDLSTLVDAQIAAVAKQAQALAETRALLLSVKSRIERSEPIDVASFCSLIQSGDFAMTNQTEAETWKQIADRYMTEEAKADFAAVPPDMYEVYDQPDYAEKWRDLGSRIKAVLPLDPASDAALAYTREWFALLAPFSAIATPAMWNSTRAMYDHMDDWKAEDGTDPGFDLDVWQFVQAATLLAIEAKKDIGPVPSFLLNENPKNSGEK